MRIISNFHDYYDSAAGYGLDPNLIYRREPKHLVLETRVWKWESAILKVLPGPNANHVQTQLAVLGVCSRLYPVWIAKDLIFEPSALCATTKQLRCYSDEALFTQRLVEQELGWAKPGKEGAVAVRNRIRAEREAVLGTRIGPAMFRDLDAPIFLARGLGWRWPVAATVEILTNVRLASFDFQRQMDPFTAFQEIAMFLGSALAVEDFAPRTVGDDKIIAASRGFDEQSFRTLAPGTKKLNRRENRARKKGPKSE